MSIAVNDDLESTTVDIQGKFRLFKEIWYQPLNPLLPPKSLKLSEWWLMSSSPASSPLFAVPLKNGDNNYVNQSPLIYHPPQSSLPHLLGGSRSDYSCHSGQSSCPMFAETIKFGMGRFYPPTDPPAAKGDSTPLPTEQEFLY